MTMMIFTEKYNDGASTYTVKLATKAHADIYFATHPENAEAFDCLTKIIRTKLVTCGILELSPTQADTFKYVSYAPVSGAAENITVSKLFIALLPRPIECVQVKDCKLNETEVEGVWRWLSDPKKLKIILDSEGFSEAYTLVLAYRLAVTCGRKLSNMQIDEINSQCVSILTAFRQSQPDLALTDEQFNRAQQLAKQFAEIKYTLDCRSGLEATRANSMYGFLYLTSLTPLAQGKSSAKSSSATTSVAALASDPAEPESGITPSPRR